MKKTLLFRVLAVWLWDIPGAVLTALLITLVLGHFHADFSSSLAAIQRSPYLLSYAEIVSTGLLPLILTVSCRERFFDYGIRFRGLFRSLAYCAPIIAIILLLNYFSGQPMWEATSFHLSFPSNVWYAALGIFAYGPLEVFFVVWLIKNTDELFHSSSRLVSKGLVITVVLFGLLHLVTSAGAGVTNAFRVMAEFFVLGLIYKSTGNAIGPMVAWSLINGQVWALSLGSLMP